MADSNWDNAKEAANWRKHRVRFDEADTVFNDPKILVIDDPDHSQNEDRFIAIGESEQRRLLVVSYTIRGDEQRLISARTADVREKWLYMGSDMIHEGDDDEMRPYYDFSKGIRGKHYRGGSRTMVGYGIEADVAAYFPTNEDVEKALRMLIEEGRTPVKPTCK